VISLLEDIDQIIDCHRRRSNSLKSALLNLPYYDDLATIAPITVGLINPRWPLERLSRPVYAPKNDQAKTRLDHIDIVIIYDCIP